ncbi:MAG: hypothetical protein JWQ38_463 [Flavipsychrobacter sp.]|nr:hypothetical protein [Flavipsychrobacter sp.]
MRKLTVRITLLLLVIIFNALSVHAQQQFKWVKGGGTNVILSAPDDDEGAYFMCTDKNKNVYVMNVVGHSAITADTFHTTTSSVISDQNVLITSYNCNGQMRWSRLIAVTDGINPYGITADNAGHIYVAGRFVHLHTAGGYTMYIGSDTALAAGSYAAVGVIQLDTNGKYKWMNIIGANTPLSLTGVGGNCPITVDGANNAHYFCYMKTGVQITTSLTAKYGVYDLTYSPGGTLLSAVRLDLDSQWWLTSVVIDPGTNKLYACGKLNPAYYSGIPPDTTFAAAFDASRNKIWKYYSGSNNNGVLSAVVMDQSKHLNFIGAVVPYTLPLTFSFNGDSVIAPGFYGAAIVMQTDTNAKVNWIRHFDAHTSSIYSLSSITQLPNNKMAVGGLYGGRITFGTIDSIETPTGEGQNPYLAILNSTGDLQTLQMVHGDGFYDWGLSITSDTVGNVYLGGQVESKVWAGTLSPYTTVGGNSDFFVLKYGVDCSCTNMPIAALSSGVSSYSVTLTYTGTTSGIDSIIWYLGDGSTASGTTVVHTYGPGTFRACATAYTSCGNDIYCYDVVVTPSGCRPKLCLFDYNLHNDNAPNWDMTTIQNIHPDILIDNTPGGYYGPPNSGLVCLPAKYTALGIQVYSQIIGGYEGTHYGAPKDDLASNLSRIDDIAKDGSTGVFLNEVTNLTLNTATKTYLTAIYNQCRLKGLKLILGVGSTNFDTFLINHCDYLLSDVNYDGTRLPTSSELPYLDRIIVIKQGLSTPASASAITLGARSFGFGYSYACNALTALPNWIGTYARLIDQPITTTPVISVLSPGMLKSDNPYNNQWYELTLGLIPGATGQTYTPTKKGTYYVVTTTGGCSSDKSNQIFVVPVGIDKVEQNDAITIYPNPANDGININGISTATNYRMLTVTGITISKGALQQGDNIISMRGFTPGIYMLEMTTADGDRKVVRVVKE